MGVFFVVVILFSSLCAAEPRPLRFGIIGAFSGAAAPYGVATRHGIELALEDLGPDAQLRIIYEDDGFEPARTVSAFKKLTEIDKVDALEVLASQPSSAVAPLAESKGIPLFALASDTNVSRGRKFVARIYPSGEREGEAIAEQALRFGHQTMAGIFSVNAYPASVERGFVAACPKEKLVLVEDVVQETNDFRSILLKLRTRNVDGVFLCLNPGQLGQVAKQARTLGLKVSFFGCENLNNLTEVKLAEGALDEAWSVTLSLQDTFRKRYQERFGNGDYIAAAAVTYELVKRLGAIAERNVRGAELLRAVMEVPGESTALIGGRFKTSEEGQFLDAVYRLAYARELFTQ